MSNGTELRSEFVDLIRQRLVGPRKLDEILTERPDKTYLCGMLFPRDATAATVVSEEPDDPTPEDFDEEEPEIESPTDLMFQRLPSSVGLTFAVDPRETSLKISGAAALYERPTPDGGGDKPPRKGSWHRRPLPPFDIEVDLTADSPARVVLDGRAEVFVRNRLSHDARVVTVALINKARLENEDDRIDPSHVLYQVALRCMPSKGIPAYPDAPTYGRDEEAEELALQYRSRPTYAVGHGSAVRWPSPVSDRVAYVEADFVPSFEIAPVTAEIDGLSPAADDALSLYNLQDENFRPHEGLKALIDAYAAWRSRLGDVPPKFAEARNRVVARIDGAIARMKRGAEILRDDEALRIFRLANRAMLLNLARQRKPARTEGRKSVWKDVDLRNDDLSGFKWRPFQVAFFLLTVEGLWNPKSPDRDEVDLIWFPTGGGKTEAYLLVSAFEMIRRRVVEGERGEGTAVVKRYTLRLLTIQQFERAGGLICALETLRRRGDVPGKSPFSLGLWVGAKSAPNSDKEALADLAKIADSEGRVEGVRLPLQLCPACGTTILPASKRSGLDDVGIRKSPKNSVELYCRNASCPFHEALPINYVDDALYRAPPTMLLGTVDKFAMMTWNDRARAFFGQGVTDPPSLVIQDELHLISGPLGTLTGVYEAALDCAIRRMGRPPKIICATATIRRAVDQIRRLYGRSGSIFPSAGIDASDSFFSRAAASSDGTPGRLYLGAMGQGHTPTFSNVLASAALLDAAAEMRKRHGDVVDPWWTLVSYHNSKRELGRMLTLARDDISTRLQAVGSPRRVSADNVAELSANLRDSEIPEMIQRLKIELPHAQALDFVACTNMLSVGIDISRLGLMLVSGQPKTVSEYIQASSRVGRDQRRPPGVVLSLLSPTRPRDRSHYEFFGPFHAGFYRHVEPTSVTPYALPARERALHGAFVALVRLVSTMHKNEHASALPRKRGEIEEIARLFVARIRDAEPSEADACAALLEQFLRFWQGAIDGGKPLRFHSDSKQYTTLIKQFWAPGDGWETLTSLRHVNPPLQLKPKSPTPSRAPSP